MKPDRLFIEKLNHLRSLIETGEEYDLLVAGGILRHLFVDEVPLVVAVNKKFRLNLEFHVGSLGIDESMLALGLTYAFLEDEIDGTSLPSGYPVKKLSLNRFLDHCVAISNGTPISIRDIIKHAANAAGGVHHVPKKEQIPMAELSGILKIMGLPVFIRSIGAIGRTAVATLSELEREVRKELTIQNGNL